MLLALFSGIFVLASSAPEHFGAPLPAGAVLVKKSSERDSYGQVVAVSLYRATSSYDVLKRFPLPEGALIAVLERRPPPEVGGETGVPERIEIPRAVFDRSLPQLRR